MSKTFSVIYENKLLEFTILKQLEKFNYLVRLVDGTEITMDFDEAVFGEKEYLEKIVNE